MCAAVIALSARCPNSGMIRRDRWDRYVARVEGDRPPSSASGPTRSSQRVSDSFDSAGWPRLWTSQATASRFDAKTFVRSPPPGRKIRARQRPLASRLATTPPHELGHVLRVIAVSPSTDMNRPDQSVPAELVKVPHGDGQQLGNLLGSEQRRHNLYVEHDRLPFSLNLAAYCMR